MRRNALLLVLVAFLAACEEQPAPAPSASLSAVFRAQVDQFLQLDKPSELQRSILADYWVTDAEIHEAQNAMQECLTKANPELKVTFKAEGGYEVGPVDPFYKQYGQEVGDQKFQEVVDSCGHDTVDTIDHFYVEPRRNPEGTPYAELVRRCFKAHGVTDGSDLSSEAFNEMISSSDYKPSTPEAQQCRLNPYGS